MTRHTVVLNVNGDSHELNIEPHKTLLEVLRDVLDLRGTHPGCDSGDCGACTVLMDGKAVPSSVVVVFDESYHDFVEDPDYSNSLDYVNAGQDNVIVLHGFSKSYGMANWRIGYAIATQPMIVYLSHAQLVFNTSDAVLYAAAAALDDESYLRAARNLILQEKQFLYKGLSDLDLSYIPTQANFMLLINLPRPVKEINEEMLRRGIIIRPMGGFGLPDAIRVTVGTHEENEKVLKAFREITR